MACGGVGKSFLFRYGIIIFDDLLQQVDELTTLLESWVSWVVDELVRVSHGVLDLGDNRGQDHD